MFMYHSFATVRSSGELSSVWVALHMPRAHLCENTVSPLEFLLLPHFPKSWPIGEANQERMDVSDDVKSFLRKVHILTS